MAKKKTVAEPQEEPMQDAVIPAEDIADSDGYSAPTEDVPEGCWDASTDPADFPVEDEPPFNVSAEDAGSEDNTFGEPSDVGGGDTALDGASDAPAMEDGDYTAFLQAVSEGGGVEPVSLSEAAPLMLEDDGDGTDDLPPLPEGDSPGYDEPTAKDSRSSKTENRRSLPRREGERVLTINPRAEVQTQEDLADLIWHELQNANRTRHILTGKLDSIARTQNGMDAAVILYKGVRVLIPLKEMGVHTGQVPNGPEYTLWVSQVTRILNARQNSDIDFVVRGIDEASRTVVGSRRDAMQRKRRRFYMDADERGNHLIEEGRVVQARVVAVAEKVLRLEVFGVECNATARGFSWMWLDDVREKHYVGELILVRIQRIERPAVDRVRIWVDSSSIFGEDGDNLSLCQPQCRYVGQVATVRKGRVFVRLNIGAKAIAHTCLDMRMPGKKDTVSFTVTRIDEEKGIALGIITRIIKQNL